MPAFLRTGPARTLTGLGCWGLAIAAYLVGWWMTMGKPTEEYLASAAGHWKYDTAPGILLAVSSALVLLGFGLISWALLARVRMAK